MASVDTVFVKAQRAHTCTVAADRIGELLLDVSVGVIAGAPTRSSDPPTQDDPLSLDEYVDAGILTADQVAPITGDVYFMLKVQRTLTDAEQLTFVFEASSDADLTGISQLRLSIRDQSWTVLVRHISRHNIQAQVKIKEQDVLDRRKRLVLRPIKVELMPSIDLPTDSASSG